MKLEDGVVKFQQIFNVRSPLERDLIKELNHWRNIFYELKLIGHDKSRYYGAG